MSDTQGPRYEIFVQDRPGRPHQHAGSVHAADPEMALLNGRDVFARRPECSSLWAAPASAVLSRTAQQLADPGNQPAGPEGSFEVFLKLDPRGTLVHLGSLQSVSGTEVWSMAASLAAETPLVIWLVPSQAIVATEPEQADSLFSPGRDKGYRDQAYYRVHTELRRLRRDREP